MSRSRTEGLLAQAHADGVQLSVVGGQVRWRGRMLPTLLDQLREHKDALLELLSATPGGPCRCGCGEWWRADATSAWSCWRCTPPPEAAAPGFEVMAVPGGTTTDAVADAAFDAQEDTFLARTTELMDRGLDRDLAERVALAELLTPPSTRSPDEEMQIIAEDLAREGTSLAKVKREMRARLPVKPERLSQEEERQRRWARAYLAELDPGPGAPSEPCSVCNGEVFYRLGRRSSWRCRRCYRPDGGARVQWYSLPRVRG